MGVALYRKYRSRNFSEVIGQEHITKALVNALKKGAIRHAYLFTGPKGVGKTSVARILAHEINQLPYDSDTTHLDIIEIDAASNRRIDEIRDLRDKVNILPSVAKFKVYIVDEVHMLTKEAFNALLKTLEEPPAHVVFILATTESHKLPETIISRCLRFSFKPVELTVASQHLRQIANKEDIEVNDEALELIAAHGDGSFRDSISLLDQLGSHSKTIDVDDVRATLGMPPAETVAQLLDKLVGGTPHDLVIQLRNLSEQGFMPANLAKQLAQLLRQKLLDGSLHLTPSQITALLKELIEVPAARDPATLLEIVLLESQLGHDPKPATEPKISQPKAAKTEPAVETKTPANPKQSVLDDKTWQRVMEVLKKDHNTLYGLARMGTATTDGNNVTIHFGFGFHQKRFNESRNRQIITDIFQSVTGQKIAINCVVDKEQKTKSKEQKTESTIPSTPNPAPPHLDTISNIFGSAEVIES